MPAHHRRRASVQLGTRLLHPAEGRPNLTVQTDSLVTKIIVEGDRAADVEFVHADEVRRVLATEVVFSAGALSTPR